MDSETKREVLAYLVEHPEAEDTLEGIAEWWLLERAVRRGVATLQDVMQDLVKAGLVLERERHGTDPLYRVNGVKVAAIESMLADIGGGGEGTRRS